MPAELEKSAVPIDDTPPDGQMFNVTEMVKQGVSFGTAEYLRNQPIVLGEKCYFLVATTTTGDGRKITSDGLKHTSAHDIEVHEIDERQWQEAKIHAETLDL